MPTWHNSSPFWFPLWYKAMRNFFNPESWLWRGFGRLADYFLLSACWLFSSLPLVTLGPASIALYDTVAHCVRGGEGGMVRRFLKTFKNELLRGILLTVLFAVAAFVLNMGYQILVQLGESSQAMTVVSIVYFCTLAVPLGCACWCVALESRFVYSFGQLLKNSFAFTFLHLPQTALIVVIFVLALNLVLNIPFLVMIIPGAAAHLQSLFIEKVFKKYMPTEEEESIEETDE